MTAPHKPTDPRELGSALGERKPEYWLNQIKTKLGKHLGYYIACILVHNHPDAYGSDLDEYQLKHFESRECFLKGPDIKYAFKLLGLPYVECPTDDSVPKEQTGYRKLSHVRTRPKDRNGKTQWKMGVAV